MTRTTQSLRVSTRMSASMVTAALVGLAAALPAAAQPFAKPEDAVKYRRAAFTVLGRHFGVVAAMANGRLPFEARTAAENADIALVVARLPYYGFTPGSQSGDTKADPKIWSETDKFNAAAQKMQDEMGKLSAAAKTGNLDTIKTAVGATGAACKACHDSYRRE